MPPASSLRTAPEPAPLFFLLVLSSGAIQDVSLSRRGRAPPSGGQQRRRGEGDEHGKKGGGGGRGGGEEQEGAGGRGGRGGGSGVAQKEIWRRRKWSHKAVQALGQSIPEVLLGQLAQQPQEEEKGDRE